MRTTALAFIAVLTLEGCSTLGGANAHMTEGKALTDAANTLYSAATVADAAAKSGVLRGANAAKAANDLRLAQTALADAIAAYKANQDGSAAGYIAQLTTLATDVVLIVTQAKTGA